MNTPAYETYSLVGTTATIELSEGKTHEVYVVDEDVKNGDEQWLLVRYYLKDGYPKDCWIAESEFLRQLNKQRIAAQQKIKEFESQVQSLNNPTERKAKARSYQLDGRIKHTVNIIVKNPDATDQRILQAVMDSWRVTKRTALKYICHAKRRIEWKSFLDKCRTEGITATKDIVDRWYTEHPCR